MENEHSENCKDVLALLSDYLNLDLPAEACKEIEDHLAECSPCVEFAERLRQTVALCRRYRPEELPATIGEQAREQLKGAYERMLAARKAAP